MNTPKGYKFVKPRNVVNYATYEYYGAIGWTDCQLIKAGILVPTNTNNPTTYKYF